MHDGAQSETTQSASFASSMKKIILYRLEEALEFKGPLSDAERIFITSVELLDAELIGAENMWSTVLKMARKNFIDISGLVNLEDDELTSTQKGGVQFELDSLITALRMDQKRRGLETEAATDQLKRSFHEYGHMVRKINEQIF